jgi:hypothetical protein
LKLRTDRLAVHERRIVVGEITLVGANGVEETMGVRVQTEVFLEWRELRQQMGLSSGLLALGERAISSERVPTD